MHLDRNIHRSLKRCYQLGCLVWTQEACHIFYTDRIGTHILDSLGKVNPVLQRISVAESIGHGHLGICLLFIGRADRSLEVADIIHTVKDTDDINSVRYGFLNKIFYHVIRVWTVAQNILPTEKHLQLRILESVAELAESVPWIFLQEAKGCVKSSAAPALYRMISYLIHLFYDGQHLLSGHTCGDQ